MQLCSKYKIFNTEEYTYMLGEDCMKCNKRINPLQAISICQCRRFCHRFCFLEIIQKTNYYSQKLQCSQCQSTIDVDFETTTQMGWNFTWLALLKVVFLLLAMLCAAIIIFILESKKESIYRTLLILIQCLVGFLFCFFAFLISNYVNQMFYKKSYQLKSVAPTHIQIPIQQFREISERNQNDGTVENSLDLNFQFNMSLK